MFGMKEIRNIGSPEALSGVGTGTLPGEEVSAVGTGTLSVAVRLSRSALLWEPTIRHQKGGSVRRWTPSGGRPCRNGR